MNKKGSRGIQYLIFVGASILFGALIMLLVMYVGAKAVATTPQDIIALDLGLSVSTMLSAPAQMNYMYEPNTEKYSIKIDNNLVKVRAGGDESEYEFLPIEDIQIEEAELGYLPSIPIQFTGEKLKFTLDESVQNVICNKIPGAYPDKPRIKFTVASSQSEEEKDASKQITRFVEIYNTLEGENQPFRIYDATSDFKVQDIEIIVGFSRNEDIFVTDYARSTSEVVGTERISCYLQKAFKQAHSDNFNNFKENKAQSFNRLEITLGTYQTYKDLLKAGSRLNEEYSKTIYNSIVGAIS